MEADTHEKLAVDLQSLTQRAHALGLHVTAHAINNSMNAIGWEVAGDLSQAYQAGRGVRPEDRF